MLPDGVSGFGTVPRYRADRQHIADYRRACRRNSACAPPASRHPDPQRRLQRYRTVGVYGGTAAPSRRASNTAAHRSDPVFPHRRFFESNIGLENPTPNWAAIHDHTTQERGFAYVSTILDPYSRFTFMAGASYGRFQIPNTPGLTPNFTAFGISNFNSALLNENQFEQATSTVAAWQRSINGADVQLSYFNRYSRCISFPTRSAISSSTAWRPSLSLRFCQRRNRRHRLSAQRGAHAARRIAVAHRQDASDQHRYAAAARCRRQSDRRAVHGRRSEQEARLHGRRSICRTNGGSPISSL